MFISIRLKFVLAFLAIIAVTIFTFGYPLYAADRDWVERTLGQQLQMIAATAAVSVDGDLHENVISADDGEPIGVYEGREIRIFGTDEFRGIREHLRRVMEANELKTHIYTLRPSAQKGMMEFVVMTNEDPYTGNLYPANDHLTAVMSTGKPGHSELYRDQHGYWLSAYAPIRDGAGDVVGVLEVDYNATQVYGRIRERFRMLLFLGALSLAAAVLAAFLLARRITQPVLHLGEKMHQVEEGDLSVEARIETRDELQRVGETFNGMVEGLRAKQKLVAYVSKAAWEAAHKRAESDTGRLAGETKKVTLLFSDIKGFTPMASTRSAREVVEILNRYFSGMSDAVFRHGGSIDKFIGDAVMAIFEGGADHGAGAAVEAALEMQKLRLGPELDALLKTRIGINTGEVVMGDIGSVEWRLDYTCIGDNVNLTQRYESTCTPGKIHLSEATYELVKARFKAAPRGPTAMKGVERPVMTFEIDPGDAYL